MYVKGCLPGMQQRSSVQGVLLGAGHVGPLCLVHTQNLTPEGGQVGSVHHAVGTNRPGTASTHDQLTVDWVPSLQPQAGLEGRPV